MKEKPLSQSIKDFFVGIWEWIKKELSDPLTFWVFVIVCVVLSSEVWVMYILWFITGDEWFFATASMLWGIWWLPFIDFIPICLGITIGIKALINKNRSKNDGQK